MQTPCCRRYGEIYRCGIVKLPVSVGGASGGDESQRGGGGVEGTLPL